MIVNDDTVSKALQYLAIDPHPIALARKDVTDAENAAKQAWAEAFSAASGSVEAKKADAEIAVAEFRAEESKAILELERHKARVKAAEMLIEVWRSENANARAAEKVR